MAATNEPARRAPRGFTLAESMIASVVLATAVVGITATIQATNMQSAQLEHDAYARALASQLIEEIAAKPLVATDSTAGWAQGETDKTKYDTVRDYNGYTDGTPLPTLAGAPMTVAPIPFTRTVTITNPTTLFGATHAAGEFALVAVTARDANGRTCTFRRLVSKTTIVR